MMARESNRAPRPWIDSVFLGHPSIIAVLFVVLYGIAIAFLVGALASHPLLGVSTSDSVEALLALGTLTLAYAAVVQAVLAAWQRRMAVSAKLDIEFSRLRVSPSSGEKRWEPIVTSPFFITLPLSAEDKFRFVLRNFGPGTAVGIRVVGREWWPLRGPSDVGPQPTGPSQSNPAAYRAFAESLSLQPNGEHAFELELFAPTGSLAQPEKVHYRITRQIVITAEGTDVEGRRVAAPPAGLLHIQYIVTPSAEATGRAETVWALLTGQRASELLSPMPPGIIEDFAAHLPQVPPK